MYKARGVGLGDEDLVVQRVGLEITELVKCPISNSFDELYACTQPHKSHTAETAVTKATRGLNTALLHTEPCNQICSRTDFTSSGGNTTKWKSCLQPVLERPTCVVAFDVQFVPSRYFPLHPPCMRVVDNKELGQGFLQCGHNIVVRSWELLSVEVDGSHMDRSGKMIAR